MKARALVLAAVASLALVTSALANTYGSVEPIANPAVIDTGALRDQSLRVRSDFAERLLTCGIVDRVVDALTSRGAIATVSAENVVLPFASVPAVPHWDP